MLYYTTLYPNSSPSQTISCITSTTGKIYMRKSILKKLSIGQI